MNDIQRGPSTRNEIQRYQRPIPWAMRLNRDYKRLLHRINIGVRLRLIGNAGEKFLKLIQQHEQAQHDHVFHGRQPEYIYEQGVCDGIRIALREALSLRRVIKE